MDKRAQPNSMPQWRHAVPPVFHDRRRQRIGLIGGSFNPAHDGHIHMAMLALRQLRLAAVWWLVSPQNPLKSSADMAALDDRLAAARQCARRHKGIKVIAPEVGLRSTYTYKTLESLKKRAPLANFIWIMGADNLIQFSQWQRHHQIKTTMPIAVIDRPSYSYGAVSAGRKLLTHRVSPQRIARRGLRRNPGPPLWCFIAGRRHTASATALRAARH